MIRALLQAVGEKILNLLGRAYVPGDDLKHALTIARRLAKANHACTIGYFHNWRETPHEIETAYLAIASAVAGLEPKGYISVKPPAFRYDSDVIEHVALAAMDLGITMHFDSHEPETADATLQCVRRAAALGARVGLTLPGRWRRSLADAGIACQLGLRVRVVKGEWADAFSGTEDPRQGFLRVIEYLAGRADFVAVATHDAWLAREAVIRLQAAGTPCELELLHGMPKWRLLAIAREYALPVRVYIPFGVSWRPYALGKLKSNPRMLVWMARDGVLGLVNRLTMK